MPINNTLLKSKLLAFFTHSVVSVFIACAVLILVFRIWYPSPLHKAIGVTEIFLIVLAVDLIIGPLLTFVVYKPGKKNLKLDLIVIALLQLVALTYGLHTVMIGRPIWVAYNIDRFDVVRAYELQEKYQKLAKPEYASASLWGPQWVGALTPTKSEERTKLTLESLDGGADLAQRPDYYTPLSTIAPELQQRSQELSRLIELNKGAEDAALDILNKYPEADGFVPLKAPMRDMAVLIKKKTAEIIVVVPLNPW